MKLLPYILICSFLVSCGTQNEVGKREKILLATKPDRIAPVDPKPISEASNRIINTSNRVEVRADEVSRANERLAKAIRDNAPNKELRKRILDLIGASNKQAESLLLDHFNEDDLKQRELEIHSESLNFQVEALGIEISNLTKDKKELAKERDELISKLAEKKENDKVVDKHHDASIDATGDAEKEASEKQEFIDENLWKINVVNFFMTTAGILIGLGFIYLVIKVALRAWLGIRI